MTDVHIPLRVHSIAQLEAYQVTSEELSAIKREGANFGLDFSFMQFFLTIAISFLIALLTTKIESERVRSFRKYSAKGRGGIIWRPLG